MQSLHSVLLIMNDIEILPRKKKENNRDYVYRVIRENIVNLTLKPGSTISENELATALQVSRTPVRETIIELSRLDLVEVFPQKGSQITRINIKHADEAIFLRNVLERAVVRMVCEIADEAEIKQLTDNVDLYEFYLNKGQLDKLINVDNDFHALLFSIAHKEKIHKLIRNFAVHSDRTRYLQLQSSREGHVLNDHRKIVQAIQERSPDKAEQAIEEHLSRYQLNLEALLEKYPDYFCR